MLRVVLSLACCLAIASAGCSAVVTPDTSRFDAVDAGPVVTLMDSGSTPAGDDAGPPGPGVDSGPPAPLDGGPPPVDAGPGCTGSPRCEGEVRVFCAAGAEAREDCAAAGAFCESGMCEERVCEPGSRECSLDRRSVIACDERGSSATETECTFVCDDASASCILDPGDSCTGLPAITVGGTQRFSLCGESDANTYVGQEGTDCNGGSQADVGDVIYALTIATRGFYVVDVRDVDSSRSVDTVVYLRRVCDDQASQVACDDDVPCDQSDVSIGGCSGGVQVRQSRIATTLDPGTYYVVVDAFDYDSFSCGTVELRVRQPAP